MDREEVCMVSQPNSRRRSKAPPKVEFEPEIDLEMKALLEASAEAFRQQYGHELTEEEVCQLVHFRRFG